MTRIFGIDPGLGRTGFGVIDISDRNIPSLVDVGCITTPPGDLPDRLRQISDDIRSLLQEHRPDAVAVEELYFAKNVTTGLSVAHARGIVLMEVAREGLPVSTYAPARVKQAVTSSGNAPKRQVQEMVKTLLGLKDVPQPDDAADALAVALCHTVYDRFEEKTT